MIAFSVVKIRQSISKDGFIHFLIFAECSVVSHVSDSPPYFENRPEEILFGFVKYLVIGEKCLCLVGYRYDDKWLEVAERLFELLKSEYRPTELDLQMLDEQNIVLEVIKKEEENKSNKVDELQEKKIENELDKETRSIEQPIGDSKQNDDLKPWEQIPIHNWDREAVELWLSGHTYAEIGEIVFVSPERVGNRLTELRKEHGEDMVPYDEERKRALIQKSRDTT